MTPTCAKIVEILKTEHGIECPPDVSIRRTRAGYWQRSTGAWSWFLASDSTWTFSTRIGSQYPAKQVAKGFTTYKYIDTIALDPTEGNR